MSTQTLQITVEKHPTENRGRILVTAPRGMEAELDLLFQGILSSKRKEGTYPPHLKNSFVVMFETTPEWKNTP